MQKRSLLRTLAIACLTAVFAAGTVVSASSWVLCSSGGNSVRVKPLHIQYCCDGHTEVPQDAPVSSDIAGSCDPCSDEALTLHPHILKRPAQVVASSAVVAVISLPSVIAVHTTSIALYQKNMSSGHPPGYDPAVIVIRT